MAHCGHSELQDSNAKAPHQRQRAECAKCARLRTDGRNVGDQEQKGEGRNTKTNQTNGFHIPPLGGGVGGYGYRLGAM
jgi:hypothetical protein